MVIFCAGTVQPGRTNDEEPIAACRRGDFTAAGHGALTLIAMRRARGMFANAVAAGIAMSVLCPCWAVSGLTYACTAKPTGSPGRRILCLGCRWSARETSLWAAVDWL